MVWRVKRGRLYTRARVRQPIQMATGTGDESSSSLASSSAHRSGHTQHDRRATPAGSYELHVLSENARNLATPETSSDDDPDLSATCSENSPRSVKKAMSRVPLLVRSSPAQGTGELVSAAPRSSLAPLRLSLHACAQERRCTWRNQFLIATRADSSPQALMAAYLFFPRAQKTLIAVT